LLARDVHVYFFDHFLLLVRGKKGEKQTILRQPFSWDQIRVMEPWEAETLVQGSIWQPDTAVTTSLQVHKSIRESFGTLRSKVFGGSKKYTLTKEKFSRFFVFLNLISSLAVP